MRQRHVLLALFLIPLLAVTVAGCKKKSAQITPAEGTEEATPYTPPPREPQRQEVEEPWKSESFKREEPEAPSELGVDEINRRGILRTVYFAYDSDELSQLARQTLRENAEWLKAHTDLALVIEGHCDERGTIEYNLALGQRRAAAVRDYLATLGVNRNRVRAVSYGEERPVDPGHDEAAWSQNRRAEFKVE